MSTKLQAMYRASKELMVKRLQMAYIVANISAILPETIPFLSPIIYTITGYPPPDKWFTPFGFEEA